MCTWGCWESNLGSGLCPLSHIPCPPDWKNLSSLGANWRRSPHGLVPPCTLANRYQVFSESQEDQVERETAPAQASSRPWSAALHLSSPRPAPPSGSRMELRKLMASALASGSGCSWWCCCCCCCGCCGCCWPKWCWSLALETTRGRKS